MNTTTVLTPSTLPFAQRGHFYRGNLHGHSTNSDGIWSPAEYVRQYRQNGYDFVALTDHCLEQYGYPLSDTREFRSDDFTTLIGAELHPGQIESGSVWHLLAVGLPLDFETHREGDTGASVARRVMEAGAFLAATHPDWYCFTVADFETRDAADAIECYNGGADAGCDRGHNWHFIDMLLHRGHRVGVIAVDDLHAGTAGLGDFMRGWGAGQGGGADARGAAAGAQSRELLCEHRTPTAQCRISGARKAGGRMLASAADLGHRRAGGRVASQRRRTAGRRVRFKRIRFSLAAGDRAR